MPRRPQKALSPTLAPLRPVEACHGASAAPAPACSATRHARLRRALSSSTSRVQRASEAVGNRLKPGVQRIRSWQAVPSEVAQTIHEQRSAGANPLVAAHVAAQQQLAKLGKHPGLPVFLLLASATSICSGTLSLARCVVTFVTRRVPFLGRPVTRVLHLAVPGTLLMPLAAAYVAMAALQGFQQEQQQQEQEREQQCSSRRSPFSAPAAPRGASGRLVMVRKPSYSSLEEQRSSSSGSGSNRSSTSSEDPRQPRMPVGIITSPMRSPARPYTPDVRPAAAAPPPAAPAAAAAHVAASSAVASGERAGPSAAADTAPDGAAAIYTTEEAVFGPPSRARRSLELPGDTPECLVPPSDTAAPVTSAGGAGALVLSTSDAAAPGATAVGPAKPPSAATQHAAPLSDTAAPVTPPGDAAGPPTSSSDTAAAPGVLSKDTAAAVAPPGDTTQLPVSCSDTAAPATPRKDTPGLMTAASDVTQGLPSSSNAAAQPCVSTTDTNALAMAAPEVAAEVVALSDKAVQPPGHRMEGTSAKAATPVDLALALLEGPTAAAAAAAAGENGGTAAAAAGGGGGETEATVPAGGVGAAPPGSWHVETYVPHPVTPLDALAPTEITRKRSSTAATCEQVVTRELQHNALQVEAAAELPPVVARVSSGRGVCRITAAAAAKQALAASQAAAAAAAASAAAAGAGPVSASGQAEGAPVGIHLVRFGSGSRSSSQGWESGSSTPSITLSPSNSLGLPSSSGGPTAGGRYSHLLSPTYRSPRVSDDNMPPRGVAVAAAAAGQGPAVTAGYPAAAPAAAGAVAAAKVAAPASRPAASTAGNEFSQGLPTAAPAQAGGPGSPSGSGSKQALPTAAPQPPRPAVAAVVAALEQQQRELAQRRQLEALSRVSLGRSSVPLKPEEREAAPALPVLARTSSSGGVWQGVADAAASSSGVKETGSAPPVSISHIAERREGVQFTSSNPLAAAAAARVRLSSS